MKGEYDEADALRTFSRNDEICEHGDTCRTCRQLRLGGQVAKEMIARGDTGPGCLLRWAEEFEHRRHAEPETN